VECLEKMRVEERGTSFLPHEWVFGSFLLMAGGWLFASSAARDTSFVFFGCIAAVAALAVWTARNPTPWRWRVRLFSSFVVMGAAFYAIGVGVPLLGKPSADSLLLGWDRALIGETPAVSLEPWLHPWMEDVAMAGYLFFFYYLLAGPAYYSSRDMALFRRCIVGLFTMYGLAFTGYIFFPAGGPHHALVFHTALHGPLLVDSMMSVVDRGSNAVDVFPSVHVAATFYLLLFDWQHNRRRFWWVLVPCMVLWVSTVYLRFHYFVDLLAGVGVALIGAWVARR
jgi:membrane-associated phospholipid phosphatase